MRLSAALIALIEEPDMKAALDALIPETQRRYVHSERLICICCPVAIYLANKVGEPVYVGFTAAYLWNDRNVREQLPDAVYDYVRINNENLLKKVLG
jgi:hypothetical protein